MIVVMRYGLSWLTNALKLLNVWDPTYLQKLKSFIWNNFFTDKSNIKAS